MSTPRFIEPPDEPAKPRRSRGRSPRSLWDEYALAAAHQAAVLAMEDMEHTADQCARFADAMMVAREARNGKA